MTILRNASLLVLLSCLLVILICSSIAKFDVFAKPRISSPKCIQSTPLPDSMGGGYIEKCCWYQWDDDPAAADKSAVHMCQQCQHYDSGSVTCDPPTPGFRIAQPPNVFTSGNNIPPSAGKIGNSTNTVTSSNNNTAVLPAGGIIKVPPRTTNALHTGANAGNATNTGNNAGTLPVLTKEHNTSTPKLSSVENPTNQQTSGHHHHKGEQNGGGTSSTGNTQSGSTNNNPSSGGNNNGKSDNSNGKK